ncbi:MAG: glycosyltransferase family 2 protein [Desulfuromonadales bacterium]
MIDNNLITIIIPTLNEEETIATVIEQCKKYGDEIIVVDGHSTDKTRDIAGRLNVKVIVDNGTGKGAALRQALSIATGDIIVFFDADGSHDPLDIPKLIRPIVEDRADHVTGSRILGGSSELFGGFNEFLRLAGSSFITECINWRYGVKLSDSQNGFRAIKRGVAIKLGLQENITTIEQEMVMRTLKKGYRMSEVPSHEHRRVVGDSKIKLSKVWFRYGYSLVKHLFF